MRSLRAQVLLGAGAAAAGVLFGSGALLDALVSRALRAEFDEALAARAGALAELVEVDDDGISFELAEHARPAAAPEVEADVYELRLSDGTLLARSPALGESSLAGAPIATRAGAPSAPAFHTIAIAANDKGGAAARALRVTVRSIVPRNERSSAAAGGESLVTLAVGRDTALLEIAIAQVRRILLSVSGVGLLLTLIALAWAVTRGLRPVGGLSRRIASIGAAQLGARMPATALPRELRPIAEGLNGLLARLEEAFARERRFTGDAAHELRTPLAGLRAKLELALSRERDGAAYRAALSDCLEIGLQMQRTVEGLLQLARTEAGQIEFTREPVDVAALLHACATSREPRAAARGLQLECRLPGAMVVETDRELLRIVIENLLDNALVHVPPGEQVVVSAAVEPHALEIAVANGGCRLSTDQLSHIFERFWRADPSSRSGEEPHSGLGLALCRAIIAQLGGEISAVIDAAGRFVITTRVPKTL